MKQFFRALVKEFPAFKQLEDFFPKLYEAKVEAGVFIGFKIKKIKIMECMEFPPQKTKRERAGWDKFCNCCFLASWGRPKIMWSLLKPW